MLALGAVEPQGGGGGDLHGVDGDLAGGGARGDVHVAGEHAGGARVVGLDGGAGVVEVGLHHAVVPGQELELDHVAHVRLEVVREELEVLVLRRDGHHVHLLRRGEAQEGSGDGTG